MTIDHHHAARRRIQIAMLLALRVDDRCAKASAEWLLYIIDKLDADQLLQAMLAWEGAIIWQAPGVPATPLPRLPRFSDPGGAAKGRWRG